MAIMNAIPDSPPSGYAAVKNVIVANNTFFDCNSPWNFCVGSGVKNCTVRPESTLVINNLVYCPEESELIVSFDKTDGITLENNIMTNEKGPYKAIGTVSGDVLTRKAGGVVIPFTLKEAGELPFVTSDILGRSFDNPVIGAFQNSEETPKVVLASAENCGPLWYKSVAQAKK